nr:glycosyltransferase [Conchiformibius kuhniae]
MSLYYREKPEYLRKCLNSLAMQTKAADQIVLVYDGEVGAALEAVVAKFSDLPLEIVRLPENIGLGRALNVGLDACRHEWVFRMDTDDMCIPERFEKQCAFIETNPEIDLFGGQISEFSHRAEQPDGVRRVPLQHHEICKFAKKRNPFNHMTVAYKKSCVMKAGGYQHHLYMEDYNLWLRMLAQGAQTANLPDALVQVRSGEQMVARRGRFGIFS